MFRPMQHRISPIFLALFTAGFLWPSEDAVNGGGLALVVLLVAFALTCLLGRIRHGAAGFPMQRPRFGLSDLAVCLLVVGHWVSTLSVFFEGTNCRAALNLSFAWLGLLVSWAFFRSLMHRAGGRALLLSVLISLGAGQAALGIWQHHGFYSEQGQWYLERRQELDRLSAETSAESVLEASRLRAELASQSALYEGNERIRFEQRLLHSSEPLGVFALANTLSGLLAVCLVTAVSILMAGTRAAPGTIPRYSQSAVAVAGIVIVYCLVLTKSRSAWLGGLVGLAVLLVPASARHVRFPTRRWFAAGVLIVAAVTGLAAWTGALDRQVLQQSPRSLQYRLQYWTGTLIMLETRPLTGSGPGNFRNAYLRHKLPESSEEIQDPHNLFFDAWASGGLVSLAGLVLLLTVNAGRRPHLGPELKHPVVARRLQKSAWIGLLTGFLIHTGIQWAFGQTLDIEEWQWLLVPAVAAALLPFTLQLASLEPVSLRPALAALTVHLLAAGSLQFPVIGTLLLLCAADAVRESRPPAHRNRTCQTVLASAGLTVVTAAAGLVVAWGVLPVTASRLATDRAEFQRTVAGNPAGADTELRAAIAADPLDPIPRQRFAELEAYRFQQAIRSAFEPSAEEQPGALTRDAAVREALDKVAQAAQAWAEADSSAAGPWRLLAACQFQYGIVRRDDALIESSAGLQRRVVQSYPTSARDWAALAWYQSESNDVNSQRSASEAAQLARQLDQVNRDWRHSDRYLSDEELARLEDILTPNPTGNGV